MITHYGSMERAWAEIDLHKLEENVKTIQNLLPKKCKFMAVVKANAYGHGDVETAAFLNKIGVEAFAVATLEEGIHLRKCGIQGEILILGYTHAGRARELSQEELIQTVVDREHGEALNKMGFPVKVHIKVDTGMHRLGESYWDSKGIGKLFLLKNLMIQGIYTHLCVADSKEEEDVAFTKRQIQHFYETLREIEKKGYPLPLVHIQSSYGVLNYPELQCDYARIGIALYGVYSKEEVKTPIELKPIMAIRSRVALVRKIKKGESVSYGRNFTAKRDTKVAVLPIGYADGLPRNMSGGQVLIDGKKAPIIGRICMDQLMVDVTDIPDVQKDSVATLIGKDGKEERRAEEVAANAGTITNELLSRLSTRIHRIYVDS